jgi:hypothetical protein
VEPWPTPDTPGPGQESVWDYPRPPGLEEFSGSITIELGGQKPRLILLIALTA